ncbi:hypothetical protein [Bradyrhizobium sp. Tv2a-2]|uniref:hypothetical protein n=1 Tax=Bradyrhizobium sp. Tv2a-2 TaxID=113395 RepID=UPI0012EB1B7A|nr:hypothetical protein [Bradyrhizobium sp. Tv2a-2]
MNRSWRRFFAWGHNRGHNKKPQEGGGEEASPDNVINLMDALRQSLASDETAKPAKPPQAAKSPAKKRPRRSARRAKGSPGDGATIIDL